MAHPSSSGFPSSRFFSLKEQLSNCISWEFKLEQLLLGITSPEYVSEPLRGIVFSAILQDDHGGDLLRLYVQSSPKCSELLDAWKLRQGKCELSYIFELIVDVLSHPQGKSESTMSRQLDKFARTILGKYLLDIYIEMDSTDIWRQQCALLLMASIVRRGPSLADKVLKCFDFKHPSFTKLAERIWPLIWEDSECSLRRAYVGFAMSFIEVGNPQLLSCVLQQKKMYSGVLHSLSSDNDETVIYVLSTLREKVLLEESFVPPSCLFRTVALGQLTHISAWGRQNAELAFNFLALACTDPCNGLMPDLKRGLKGNMKRIIKLMKSLDPIKAQYHRDLLVAIVNGRPSFGFLYLKEFPYNIKKLKSHSWLAEVCLTTSLISLISDGLHNESFNSLPHELNKQEFMDWMVSSFSPSLIRKGLLHACMMVKHAIVRLLVELKKLLDTIILLDSRSLSTNELVQRAESIKQGIQDDVRASLPDLKGLLPLQCSGHVCVEGFGNPFKYSNAVKGKANFYEEYLIGMVGEIWGVGSSSTTITSLEEVERYVVSKVTEASHSLQRLQGVSI